MRLKVDRLLNSLIPRSCVFCGLEAGERACCEGCFADLPWITNPCRHCGVPLPQSYPQPCCINCRKQPHGSLPVLSALVYEYPIDRIIADAKFRPRLDFAVVLGELLAAYLCRAEWSIDLPDIIVPVPFHQRRLASRGFNQAAEIAMPVAASLGLPLRVDLCDRIRQTLEQTQLTGLARRRNPVGAFVARCDLAGLRVAIVDDVLTTGTTARAVATALMERGASDAQIWTVARTG